LYRILALKISWFSQPLNFEKHSQKNKRSIPTQFRLNWVWTEVELRVNWGWTEGKLSVIWGRTEGELRVYWGWSECELSRNWGRSECELSTQITLSSHSGYPQFLLISLSVLTQVTLSSYSDHPQFLLRSPAQFLLGSHIVYVVRIRELLQNECIIIYIYITYLPISLPARKGFNCSRYKAR